MAYRFSGIGQLSPSGNRCNKLTHAAGGHFTESSFAPATLTRGATYADDIGPCPPKVRQLF